jgi:hypothetical protein
LKQIGTILLSVFIFIASINIVINQHFCNGELESIAFFIEAQPCEHATPNNDNPPCHAKSSTDQKKCCSENQLIVVATNWLKVIVTEKTAKSTFNVENPVLLGIHDIAISSIFSKAFLPKKVLIPPLIREKAFIWNEAYLL